MRAIRFVSYGRPPRTAPERGSSNLYAERAEISPGASSQMDLQTGDQVCVFSFSPFLQSALNFTHWSLFRIDFASCMYLCSLASEQPAF